MIWSALQRFGTMGISFVSNIVLARLLTPDDYGCIGMLAIFITVSNTFVDGGFGAALIQKKEPTQKDYSTIFWLNLFISVVIYGILYISAPAVSRFYDIPLLSSVLRVQGIVLIINALNIVQSNQLRKSINFKHLAVIYIASQIVGAVCAIVLAYMGWGVWALVAQQIIASSITSVMLWVMNRWLPQLCFSFDSFKQLFSFGGFILASNLINTFCNNVQGLLLGKFFNPAILGYYTQARKLEEIASQSFSSVVDQVSYPVLSKLQSDNVLMRNVLQKLTSSLAYITFPLMLILILITEPLIMLLYGEKWLPCVPYFQILCIAGIAICLQGISYNAVASKGASKDLFIWTIVKRSVALVILIVCMYFGGMIGLMWGCSIGSWVILLSNLYLVRKYIRYGFLQQIKDLLPIIALSLLTFVVVYSINVFLNIGLYSRGVVSIILYVVIYVVLSILLKIKSYFLFKEMFFCWLKRN